MIDAIFAVLLLQMQVPVTEVVVTAVGIVVANGIVQLGISSRATSKFEGAVGEKLKNHDNDITSLKESKSEMWTKINKHDTDIARIEEGCKVRHHGK